MISFTLYSRAWCHLCDDMKVALEDALTAIAGGMDYRIDVIDIDTDAGIAPDLAARYDELVPVLIAVRDGGSPEQLCHYFLDMARLRAFLTG